MSTAQPGSQIQREKIKMTTNIEVVESRSDDETTCCGGSCRNNSSSPVPVHAPCRSDNPSDDEVRDDGGGSGNDDERTSATTEHEYLENDDDGSAQQYFDAHDCLGGGTGTGMPQIPEEVEPTPSSEESELSAGSKGTETTVGVSSYDGTAGSVGSGSEAVHVHVSSVDNSDIDPSSADVAIVGPEDEDLTAVASDDAVIATTTEDDDNIDGTRTDEGEGEKNRAPPNNAPNNTDVNLDQDPRATAQSDELALARQQWEDAMLTLKKNPALMTAEILNLSLAHRAPLHVVSAMLRINPVSAGVPSSGPSALQVAIKQRCSVDVIECIIRACPYALFDSCGQTYDPLSLAKIYRREEKPLLDLLSLPISHWTGNASQHTSTSKGRKTVRFESAHTQSHPTSGDSRPPPPPPPAPILKSASHMTKEEKRELSNMKLIIAAIVKSQKKLMAEVEETSRKVKKLAKSEDRTRREVAEFVEERMKKIAKSHLIAIDMKERAFESKVDSFGDKIAGRLVEATLRQDRADSEREERDAKLHKTIDEALSTIVAAASKVEKASASYDTKLVKIDEEVNSLKMRQDQLEDKIVKTSSSHGGCNADVFEEPSFDIESIPETTSTDNLFSDDVECAFDETLVSDLYQIESSFSSEWNASTQRLVVDEPVYHSSASWWRATGKSGNSTRKRRWIRWFTKLR